METIIRNFIYLHAFLGGIGLLTGLSSVLVKKGSGLHKLSGKIFTYSMGGSSLISLVIAQMPNHKNTFLFLIGIFTIYLLVTGNRALNFKQKDANAIDKVISAIMLLISFYMLVLGVIGLIQNVSNTILYLFFGGIGILLTVRDFIMFNKLTLTNNNKLWLVSHLGKMTGALIASFSAFLIAGLHLGELFFWITPSIPGTLYIIYWSRKIKGKTS